MSTTERDDLIHLVNLLNEIPSLHEDMLVYMKKVIEIDPALTENERNLLSISYKTVIDTLRQQGRDLAKTPEPEFELQEESKKYLNQIETQIKEKIIQCCEDLLSLIDEKLLPNSKDVEAKVFYMKLKGDYFRYMCEVLTDSEKEDKAAKAEENYKEAIKLAEAEIQPFKPISLGIYLNYSVFLYETVSRKQEALELAEKTFQQCAPLIEQNSAQKLNEAEMIINLMSENIMVWKQAEAGSEEDAE